MIDYSHDNSLVFGYNGGVFNERQYSCDVLSYTLRPCAREPLSFKEELIETAKLMQQKALVMNRPIYLLQSGGLDSEVMIKSFKAASVPFQAISFRFPRGENQHEIAFIEEFSAKEQLDTMFYDLDLLAWLKAPEARDWFTLSNTEECAMLPHMKLLHHIWFDLGGMPVIGGGDVVIIKQPDGTWHFSKYEKMLPWFWFCTKMEINAGVAFFQHTPEIILAALKEPCIQHAAAGHNRFANLILPDLRQVKYELYHRLWPDLRRRIKFGGTELIFQHLTPFEAKWKGPIRHNAIWHISYDQAVGALNPVLG